MLKLSAYRERIDLFRLFNRGCSFRDESGIEACDIRKEDESVWRNDLILLKLNRSFKDDRPPLEVSCSEINITTRVPVEAIYLEISIPKLFY